MSHGTNLSFDQEWFGNSFSKVSEGFSTAISIAVIFLIDLDIGQPPFTLANTSKHSLSCFRNFEVSQLNFESAFPRSLSYCLNFASIFSKNWSSVQRTSEESLWIWPTPQRIKRQSCFVATRGSVSPKYIKASAMSPAPVLWLGVFWCCFLYLCWKLCWPAGVQI